jgi:hypothetical protein
VRGCGDILMGDVVNITTKQATESSSALEDRITNELFAVIRGHPVWICQLALCNVICSIAINCLSDEPVKY